LAAFQINTFESQANHKLSTSNRVAPQALASKNHFNGQRMKIYPLNSPQAAARIVALTLVSDGQLNRAEVEVLDAEQACDQLGLSRSELNTVIHDFCADLLCAASQAKRADCQLSPELIEQLLSEVQDPALRLKVLRICIAVAHADHQIHTGESMVLLAAMEAWDLTPDSLMELLDSEATSWTR
jgi:Tellurite resistance protein TerB